MAVDRHTAPRSSSRSSATARVPWLLTANQTRASTPEPYIAADQNMPIASITKLMSAMVIIDHLDLEKTYTVSAEDINIDGDGADFEKGESFSGHELLKYALIRSSNDAITLLASAVGKQGLDMVALMNKKAEQLGMLDTHFADPAGLSDQAGYSTALDVVKMVRATSVYPEILRALTQTHAEITSIAGSIRTIFNTNQLLTAVPNVIVGKTGNTTGALGTLALEATVTNRGDALVVVVLGSNDRFGETKALVDWAKQAHTWSLNQ